MAQKAILLEAIPNQDILASAPLVGLLSEGYKVTSVDGYYSKDNRPMCLVLLSDEDSSGGSSDSDYLAPPVFSPISHPASPYTSESDSIEVTLTAEEGADIFYSINGVDTSDYAQYEEPIEVTVNGTIIYAFATKGTGDAIEVSPVVAAAYYLGGK